jgi:hypothetical protein
MIFNGESSARRSLNYYEKLWFDYPAVSLVRIFISAGTADRCEYGEAALVVVSTFV